MTSLSILPDPPGRILFLCRDADRVKAQIKGADFALAQIDDLRDDISTDEITPVAILSHFDGKLARYPYTGFTVGGKRPIAVDAVRLGNFSVVVAGQRYGKGSSREHSPKAEQLAGIRLVIAQSFERIYRQNADNIGLFTSTDFGLIARIQRGEAIAVDELVRDREPLAGAILRSGGLLRFGQLHLQGAAVAEPVADKAEASGQTSEPHTLFEKIIRRHLVPMHLTPANPAPGEGVFVRAHWRFIHEYYTGMSAHMLRETFGRAAGNSPAGEPLSLVAPQGIVVFEDHSSYVEQSPAHLKNGLVPNMRAMAEAQRAFVKEHGLRFHRTLTDEEAAQEALGQVPSNAAGISHAMVIEHYALPGQIVAGTDSHTPHSGALGCVAFGVGTTDMANAFMTGAVRLTLPETLRVVLHGDVHGELPPGLTAKDVVLHLLARPDIKAGLGVGKVFEFSGSAVAGMSIDERATLTNMTAELGGLTGIVAPDAETVAFLRERRGIDFALEPWMTSDAGATYAGEIDLDCRLLGPMVAAPGDPGNGVALRDLREPVLIDIAYGGSCTAGKREDFDHYHAVLKWALDHGLQLPSRVKLYLQYGTTAVRDYCLQRGYDKTFAAIGAQMLQPSCGACANCGPGSSTQVDQVTVSAINRNFPGRSGPGQVWLASPPTVMASALAGELMSFEGLMDRVSRVR
jgi:3-isopropylmalate/(R)-2-methylmalate dehydratase large subunit